MATMRPPVSRGVGQREHASACSAQPEVPARGQLAQPGRMRGRPHLHGRRAEVLLLLHGCLAMHDARLGLRGEQEGHLWGRAGRGASPAIGRMARQGGSEMTSSCSWILPCARAGAPPCGMAGCAPARRRPHLAEGDERGAVPVLQHGHVLGLQVGLLRQRPVVELCSAGAGRGAGGQGCRAPGREPGSRMACCPDSHSMRVTCKGQRVALEPLQSTAGSAQGRGEAFCRRSAALRLALHSFPIAPGAAHLCTE